MAFFKLLRKSPLSARIGLAMILLNIVAAILAPVIAPYGETEVVGDVWEPMSGKHLLGTDHIGRDMFTRLLYGGRNTIAIAFVITMFSFALGISCGTGYASNSWEFHTKADHRNRFAGFHPGVSPVTGGCHGHRGHGVC